MNFKQLFSVHDVTRGRPWKRIAELAIPLLIGNIAQQLYSTVDTVVVGKYIGDDALSAVGAAGPVFNLIFVLFVGLATGAGILVAQRFGAKDREGLSRTIGNVLFLAAIASVVTTILGLTLTRVPIFGGRTLLQVMQTPEGNIYEWCRQYLTVIFAGVTASIVYNISAGILRGLGDSVSALLFLLLTCGLNIILDIWFVANLGLGVPGVAIATILSQAVSATLCVIKLFRMSDVFTLTRETLKPDRKLIGRVFNLGLPSGISQGIFSMSAMLVQSITNRMGPEAIACVVVVMRIDGFAIMPFFSLSNAMTTYIGQNFGAKKLERMETGSRQGMLMSFLTAVVLVSFLQVFGRYLAHWFTDTEQLVDMTMRMIRILIVGYLAISVNMSMQGFMLGTGDTRTPMWISMFTQVAMRLPLAFLFARLTANEMYPNGQPEALYYSLVLTWVFGAAVMFCCYMHRRRKLRANADESWQLDYAE